MARLTWADHAIHDLDEICAHLARTSVEYARTFASQVRAVAESIPAQPMLGAVVPEYDQVDLRERFYHNHRIIYRIRGEDIEIVTIFLATRRLPRTPPG